VMVILRDVQVQFSTEFIESFRIPFSATVAGSSSSYPVIECITQAEGGSVMQSNLLSSDGIVKCDEEKSRYNRKPSVAIIDQTDCEPGESGLFCYPGICFKSTSYDAKHVTLQIRLHGGKKETTTIKNHDCLTDSEFEPLLVMLPAVAVGSNKMVSKKVTCYIREKSASCVVGKIQVNVSVVLR